MTMPLKPIKKKMKRSQNQLIINSIIIVNEFPTKQVFNRKSENIAMRDNILTDIHTAISDKNMFLVYFFYLLTFLMKPIIFSSILCIKIAMDSMKRRNLTCLQKLTTSLKHLSSILAQKS
jgi:hypothetical protein